MDRLPDLPWPPAACDELALHPLGATELPPELRAGQAWIRCGDRRTPLNEVFAQPRPRYRFDCPPRHDGRFQVWYGARTTLGALCEVFGEPDRRFLTLPERQRKLIGSVRWARDLRLLDLRAPRVISIDQRKSPGLDGGLASCRDYRLTRAWSETFYRCRDEIDGLLYVGRKAGDLCLALYYDRCGSVLEPVGADLELSDQSLKSTWEAFERLTGIRVGS